MHGDANNPTAPGSPEWQHLWFTLQGRPWTTLAIIDTTGGSDAETVAHTLAGVGNRDGQVPVEVVSARGATFQDLPALLAKLADVSAQRLRLVVCDTVGPHPAMIPLLQATSGAVVVVRLGTATTTALDATIDAVGRDRVLASVSIG